MGKKGKYRVLTASETLVMKCLWDAEENLSICDLFEMVNNIYHKDWKYQTISSFLAKLVAKGFVCSSKIGHKVVYEILIPQDKYKAQQEEEFINFWNRNFVGQFLMSLYHKKDISKLEIEKLRRTLDTLDA